MVYQFQYRRFVHEHCAEIPHHAAPTITMTHPNPPQEFTPTGDPLAPGSDLDKLSPAYRAEVVRWVQFHEGCTLIPGIHTEFSTSGLQKYMRHRNETTKSIANVITMLKKMGEKCGFVLCNSKYQQPSLQYQRLRTERLDLARDRREAGLDTGINEALATGNLGVTILLSAFDIRSQQRFMTLHPCHREYVTIFSMQHGGCMRFGLFRDTDILVEDLIYSAHDNCYALRTTWRKNRKSNRPYTIKFPCRPPPGSPGRYALPGARGPTYVNAGRIVHWYLRSVNLHNAPGHTLVFPRLARVGDRRAEYSKWLRFVFSSALPADPAVQSLVHRIRPHSARAGWAVDRTRQNVSVPTLLQEGRWTDPRAMAKYVRASLRDMLTSARHRQISDEIKRAWPLRRF